MRKLKDRPHALKFPEGEGRTEQSHVADCDINVILKRALRGQTSPYIRDNVEEYGEQTSIDLFEAQNIVKDAETMFNNLPSRVRNRFENDIGQFLDFIQDDANLPEAYELGLVKTPPNPLGDEIEPLVNPEIAEPLTESAPASTESNAPQL